MNMEFAANVAPVCFLVISFAILFKTFIQSRFARFRACRVRRIHSAAR